jgi:hypothetical protein
MRATSYLRAVAGVCVGLFAVTVITLTESGAALADSSADVTGQKYSDAQGVLSGAGLTPVVETTVGDQKAWSDCVVTRTQKRTVQPPPDSSGSATNEMLVSLNCEAPVASATTPGNSAASPEGRAAATSAKSGG